MALSSAQKSAKGVAARRAATPEELYTIYEVAYPDDRRRSSGESDDEAISRAYFESPGDACSFKSRNGGLVEERRVSATTIRSLRKAGLLPRLRGGGQLKR